LGTRSGGGRIGSRSQGVTALFHPLGCNASGSAEGVRAYNAAIPPLAGEFARPNPVRLQGEAGCKQARKKRMAQAAYICGLAPIDFGHQKPGDALYERAALRLNYLGTRPGQGPRPAVIPGENPSRTICKSRTY
jgi:hypothetical protein